MINSTNPGIPFRSREETPLGITFLKYYPWILFDAFLVLVAVFAWHDPALIAGPLLVAGALAVLVGMVLIHRLWSLPVAVALILFLTLLSVTVFLPDTLQIAWEQRDPLVAKHAPAIATLVTASMGLWAATCALAAKRIHHVETALIESIRKPQLPKWLGVAAGFSASVLVIIADPGVPFQEYTLATRNALPGRGWPMLALLASLVVLQCRRSAIGIASVVFVLFWLISHNARADLIGFTFLLAMVFLRSPGIKGLFSPLKGRTTLVGLALIAAIWFMLYMGNVRHLGFVWDWRVFLETPIQMLNYSTTKDISYTFAAAIEYVSRYGFESTLTNYPWRILPSAIYEGPAGAEKVLQSGIPTGGGIHQIGEFYLNGGFLLALLWAPVAFLFYVAPALVASRIRLLGQRVALYAMATTWLALGRTLWYDGLLSLKLLVFVAVPLAIIHHALATRAVARPVASRGHALEVVP